MATTPKTMPTNVGGMERMLRIIAGIAILYIGMGMGMPLWAWIGIIPISATVKKEKKKPLQEIYGDDGFDEEIEGSVSDGC